MDHESYILLILSRFIDCDSLKYSIFEIFIIQATRATFQHTYLPDTPSQNEAVKSVKDSLSSIHFDNQTFESPIAYAFMYIQWEANEVNELIPLES